MLAIFKFKLLILFFVFCNLSLSSYSYAETEEVELGHHYEEYSKPSTKDKKNVSNTNNKSKKIVLSGKSSKKSKSVASKVLLYLPNRIFDLIDIFRFRVRVGPGLGLGIRVTEPLSIYAGSHAAIYAGLPGPRQSPSIPLPVGAEAVAGGKISLLNGVFSADTSSRHSFTEIGVETQLGIVGVDLGIDPIEILDFVTGFFFIQIREDDL